MNTNLVKHRDYVAGWLDSSIHEVLDAFPLGSKSTKYVLITCIDSNVNPGSLLKKSPELQSVAENVQSLGNGLLLPTAKLLEADCRNRLFFGFDEVWFFPDRPSDSKQDFVSLVGPARIDQTKLDHVGEWMTRNACSLALGDGDGLNFIVKARGLVKHLLGHSMVQARADFPATAPRLLNAASG